METAFQKVQSNAKLVVLGSIAFSITVCWWAFDYVQSASNRMWVLTHHGAAVEVTAASLEANRLAEARHHVEFYHYLMFNISPDPKSIEYNKRRAEYLGDASILIPYEQKRESNFYNQLIGANMRQEFRLDSVVTRNFPLVKVYGKEVITRASSQLTKSLVTSCQLVDVARSDNNSNGFFMQNFKVEENKVISSANR
jgi:conjugative transposon TraK protein